MKYVIATYSPIFTSNKVPFGVILNDGSRTFYYFQNDTSMQQKLSEINPDFDKPTFVNFENTFKDMFIATGKATFTDENGDKLEIDTNKDEFLDLLAQTYEGPYQYSEPKSVDGDNPDETLKLLKNQLIPV